MRSDLSLPPTPHTTTPHSFFLTDPSPLSSISSLPFYIAPRRLYSACCSSTPCWLKSTLKVYLSPDTVRQRCWPRSTWTSRRCFAEGALRDGGGLKDAVKLTGSRLCLHWVFFLLPVKYTVCILKNIIAHINTHVARGSVTVFSGSVSVVCFFSQVSP